MRNFYVPKIIMVMFYFVDLMKSWRAKRGDGFFFFRQPQFLNVALSCGRLFSNLNSFDLLLTRRRNPRALFCICLGERRIYFYHA
jgi:hypothetical protein